MAALRGLGVLAAVATIASELPWSVSWALGCAAVIYGDRVARREAAMPGRQLVIPPNAAPVTVDGLPVDDLQVQWRGVLAFIRWRDGAGRIQRLQGWPDNLDADARRELRLAMAGRAPAHSPRSMAP